MAITIVDGSGSAYTAKVTSDNRLSTKAVYLAESQQSVFDGNAYDIDSGIIALTTTASFNGILYISNASTINLNIWGIQLSSTVLCQWQTTVDPTGGTLISDASSQTATNANTSSTLPLISTIYKATGNGKTVTGGTIRRNRICAAGYTQEDRMQILSPGKSLAFSCKPSASADVVINIRVTTGNIL